MANSYTGNVIFIDTSAAFAYAKNLVGAKILGGSTGSSIIVHGNGVSTGSTLWSALSSVGVMFDEIRVRDDQGIYVEVVGGASALLYLKPD